MSPVTHHDEAQLALTRRRDPELALRIAEVAGEQCSNAILARWQARRAEQARARVQAADDAEWGPRKIVATYSNPVIPTRDMDWCAWFDDEGAEAGNYGYGPTREAAIRDLLDTYGDGQ